MRIICRYILKVLGWKVKGKTDFTNKCVICVAPHTSNFDLPLGLLIYTSMGRRASFLMKKEWFFFPLNILFKVLGGIPVDRSKKTSLTEQLSEIFAKRENFQLAVTPEGTRKLNTEWKKGFYYIALAANVPILAVSLDYKKKEVTFMDTIVPSGDADADIQLIKDLYKGASGRHAHKFAH